MISLHATRPARIARRTSWRRDPVTGGGELETYSPFSVSMGQALWVIMIIAGPPLILMLVVGLVISMVQAATRSEEHTSELQSLMRISYAVFSLKKKTNTEQTTRQTTREKQNRDN